MLFLITATWLRPDYGFCHMHCKALPFLYTVLLAWGGLIAHCITVGIAILGEKYQGAALASANASFILAYGMGMFAMPLFNRPCDGCL